VAPTGDHVRHAPLATHMLSKQEFLFMNRNAWLTMLAIAFSSAMPAQAPAQVPLSGYMDANGFIDVQALTGAQLANIWQEDADYLVAWYSGWYNGLAKKHYAHITRVKAGEHQLILYCKAHPELKIIQALDVLFKNEAMR
jgi:hypothetical protein